MTAVLKDVGLSPDQLGDVCVGGCNTQPGLKGRPPLILLTEAFCLQETFCSLEPER